MRIDVVAAALEHGIDVQGRRIFLHGDVDEDSIGRAIRGLYILSGMGQKPIEMFVSSYGGVLDDAFALHDVTRTITCPIHTVALGKCQSAAPLLVACGQKGNRWSGANTIFMLHDSLMNPGDGPSSLLAAWAEEGKERMRKMARLLGRYTDKPARHWSGIFRGKTDRFFNAETAQEWGLIDHIWDEKE